MQKIKRDKINSSRNIFNAAKAGEWRVVKSLLEGKGANLEVRDNDGHTILYHAAESGSLEMVQWLVESGY